MDTKLDEGEIDETLRRYFAVELDGQLGRAERAFRGELRLTPLAATGPRRRRRSLRSHAWVIGAMGAAAAASMAAMWIVPVTPPGGTPVAVTQPGVDDGAIAGVGGTSLEDLSTSQPKWRQVEQVVNSMTLDDGLVLLEDNSPARLVRQVALQQVEWVDERSGVRVQAVLPREGARLIPVDTY